MANEEFVEKLLKERYCIHNDVYGDERIGNIWDNITGRVAEYLGEDDNEVDMFHKMMYTKEFLPNSPTLMNSGTEHPMLSACFYLPISDCISNGEDGIFDQVKNAALIFKYGGGVGLNFSSLRPAGSTVRSTQGVSSGVISFMKNFNTMTETIKQGGKRRGALMGCLDISHKEINEFIVCKHFEGDLSNFNISVKITDDFMKKVESGDPDANFTFNLIVDGIYRNGEPGLLFKDEIERHNPRPDLGELNPNPCAEALLPPHGSCNLGSINWSCLYNGEQALHWQKLIDWDKYERIIRASTILLNRVIDKNEYPIKKIDEVSKELRQIGLGGMGFHDLLLKQNIPYDSATALEIAEGLEKYLRKIAHDESVKRGFNNTSLTTIAPTGTISIIAQVSSAIEPVFNWVITRKDSVGEHYIVHPIFDERLRDECDKYVKDIKKQGADDLFCKFASEALYNEVIEHCHKHGTIQNVEWLPPQFKELFKNAMDISWVQHIKMQSVFQTSGVDMSISKTINLPNSATKKDIINAIFMAWKMKCKGITIYRNGSRENEVLNLKKEEKPSDAGTSYLPKVTPAINELREVDTLPEPTLAAKKAKDEQIKIITAKIKEEENKLPVPKEDPLKRPRHLYGVTYKIPSGCGKLYVTINERNGKPYEVFIQSGGSGGCEAGNQALGRAISFALRTGGNIREIIKQLNKVKCPAALRNSKSEGKSCSDIVGKLLRESIPDEDEVEEENVNNGNGNGNNDELLKKLYLKDEQPHKPELEECPQCHEKTLVRESGCKTCHACGYNKCG